MISTTKSARSILVKIFDLLPEDQKPQFRRELLALHDDIITSDFRKEFKVTPADIIKLLRSGNYNLPQSLV